MIKSPLKGADGTVTSGLNFLLNELFSLIDLYPESFVAAVSDAPAPTFRKTLYPEYKANRPPTPDDLRIQTQIARELIPMLGIPFVEKSWSRSMFPEYSHSGTEHSHDGPHAFASFNARQREGLVVSSRRGMLKAGLAGIADLSLPGLLRKRAQAARVHRPIPTGKSVILLWMAGGPSQIDTWDPKPKAG